MHFTEYDTRLAAYALIVSPEDELLLTWFNGGGSEQPAWSLPGGGIEFDESIHDGVVREVYEETGYRVHVGTILVEHHFTVSARTGRRPFRSQRFLLDAAITGGELGTTEIDGSTDFAQWVPLAEVPTLEARADIVDVALEVLGRAPRDD